LGSQFATIGANVPRFSILLHKTLFFEKQNFSKISNIFTNNLISVKAPKVFIVWCTQVLGKYPKKYGYQI
jgi:hypothetical protein